jgi:hypothetical protein
LILDIHYIYELSSNKYYIISPVFLSIFIPPSYVLFAISKNNGNGIRKFNITFLNNGLPSIIFVNLSRNAGIATQRSPD